MRTAGVTQPDPATNYGGTYRGNCTLQVPAVKLVPAFREALAWEERGKDHPERHLPCGDNFVAVIDQTTGKTYAIVSNQYDLHTHQELLVLTQDAILKLPEFGEPARSVWLSDDGGMMKGTFTFPNIKYEIRPGDFINPSLTIYNSYNRSWPIRWLLGAFRIVCANGLVVGKQFAYASRKHLGEVNLPTMQRQIKKELESLSDQTQLWQKWVDQKIEQAEYEALMSRLDLAKKDQETIEQTVETESGTVVPFALAQGQLTRWILFCIITQWLTHHVESELKRTWIETRLRQQFS